MERAADERKGKIRAGEVKEGKEKIKRGEGIRYKGARGGRRVGHGTEERHG